MVEHVEVVEDDEQESEGDGSPEPMISEPAKLMRIAVMLREVQGEARRAEADEGGRSMLRQVHERALAELADVLSSDLQEELKQFTFEFETDAPTQSQLLIAQAQLIGWLEGLFQGIQAAIFNQQAAAQKQLEAMRQRGLPPGGPQVDGQGMASGGETSPGNYL